MEFDAATLTIIGSVLGTGIGVAALIMRSISRIDADNRAFGNRFDRAMETFRAEMLRLTERQSYVEGRIDSRASGTD